jgi:hypothetical protein
MDKFEKMSTASDDKIKFLEEQLAAALESNVAASKPPVVEYDFVAADEKYIALILDGDTKAAAALQSELRREQVKAISATFEKQSSVTKDEAVAATQEIIEQGRFVTIIDSLVEKYPQLNETNKSYDQNLTKEINEVMDSYVYKGMSKDNAIVKAVKTMSRFLVEADETIVAPTKKVAKTGSTKAKSAAVKASNQQPPTSPSSVNTTLDVSQDVSKMTQAQLKALPESYWKTLLGED